MALSNVTRLILLPRASVSALGLIILRHLSSQPSLQPFIIFLHSLSLRTFTYILWIFFMHLLTIVYIEQPIGFEQEGSEMVCYLIKSLYKLKQISYLWYKKLNAGLEHIGFKAIYFDNSIYIYAKDEIRVIFQVFVDKCIFASNS